MNKELNEEYANEIAQLTTKMLNAQAFAEKFPLFRKQILAAKMQEDRPHYDFGDRYKKLPLPWGINYGHYKSDTSINITNMHESHDEWLFHLYFNTISLYDSHNEYGLEKLKDIEGVFFFDWANSRFYVRPESIESFLDAAEEWYLNALKSLEEENKNKAAEKAKAELEALGYSVTK